MFIEILSDGNLWCSIGGALTAGVLRFQSRYRNQNIIGLTAASLFYFLTSVSIGYAFHLSFDSANAFYIFGVAFMSETALRALIKLNKDDILRLINKNVRTD